MATTTVEPLPRLLRTRMAAKYLGLHRSSIYREVSAGRLKPVTFFKHWLFDTRDLDAYVDSLKRS